MHPVFRAIFTKLTYTESIRLSAETLLPEIPGYIVKITPSGGLTVKKDPSHFIRGRRILAGLSILSLLIALISYQWIGDFSAIFGLLSLICACGTIPPLGASIEIEPFARTFRVNRREVEVKPVALIEVAPFTESSFWVVIHFEDNSWVAFCEASKQAHLARLANLIRTILTPDPVENLDTNESCLQANRELR